MTNTRFNQLALAAREIVAASGVDINQSVKILPLAKLLVEREDCNIDTAKRHITRAIRLERGETLRGPGGTARMEDGQRVTIYLSRAHREKALALGDGVVSVGVQRALDAY